MSTHKRLRLSIRTFQWPAGESVARLRKRCFHITQQGCEAHRWSVTVFSPEFLDPLGGGVSDGGCTVKCDFWVLPLSFAATPPPSASSKSPQRTSSPCLHLQEHIFVVFLYFRVRAKGATEARVTQAQCKDDSGKFPASQSPRFFGPKPSFRCVESWPALPRLCGFYDLIQPGEEAALPTTLSLWAFKYQIQTGCRLTSLHGDQKCLPHCLTAFSRGQADFQLCVIHRYSVWAGLLLFPL